jgi:hypothetical protein
LVPVSVEILEVIPATDDPQNERYLHGTLVVRTPDGRTFNFPHAIVMDTDAKRARLRPGQRVTVFENEDDTPGFEDTIGWRSPTTGRIRIGNIPCRTKQTAARVTSFLCMVSCCSLVPMVFMSGALITIFSAFIAAAIICLLDSLLRKWLVHYYDEGNDGDIVWSDPVFQETPAPAPAPSRQPPPPAASFKA